MPRKPDRDEVDPVAYDSTDEWLAATADDPATPASGSVACRRCGSAIPFGADVGPGDEVGCSECGATTVVPLDVDEDEEA